MNIYNIDYQNLIDLETKILNLNLKNYCLIYFDIKNDNFEKTKLTRMEIYKNLKIENFIIIDVNHPEITNFFKEIECTKYPIFIVIKDNSPLLLFEGYIYLDKPSS